METKIQSIINHPIYSQITTGIERSDGILGELLEEEIISEKKYNNLIGKELKMNTVEEILVLIS
ncbi:MAG: hypothetical protein KAT66_00330 [Candidatus Lokiarchaeota archaeon]|nr:hypothetical protein [Candidatus Lokiarchaeota archaeon]